MSEKKRKIKFSAKSLVLFLTLPAVAIYSYFALKPKLKEGQFGKANNAKQMQSAADMPSEDSQESDLRGESTTKEEVSRLKPQLEFKTAESNRKNKAGKKKYESKVFQELSSDDQKSSEVAKSGEVYEIYMPRDDISEADRNLVPVHVTGAVEHPGVYVVEMPAFLYEVIAEARPLPDADLDILNLARTLQAESRIYVPLIGEIEDDELIEEYKYAYGEGYADQRAAYEKLLAENPYFQADGKKEPDENSSSAKININTAEIESLVTLPGIGDSTAAKIIKYRNENGGFNSIEELMNVPGIKEGKYAAIEEFLTVN